MEPKTLRTPDAERRETHPRRCAAKLSDGSRRCRKYAVKGTTVCPTHGASAPQVKRSARERLDALVDPVISLMTKAIGEADSRPGMELHPQIIKLSQAILDRCGYKPVSQVELLGLENARVEVVKKHGNEVAAIIGDVLRASGIDTEDPAVRSMLRSRLEAQTDEDVERWRRAHPPPETKST